LNGPLFDNFLKEAGLQVPVTFEDAGNGNVASYSKDGVDVDVTLDYVAISKNFRYIERSAGKPKSVDPLVEKLDHVPAVLAALADFAPTAARSRRRVANYSRGLTKDPFLRKVFDSLVQNLPKINANVEPTSHHFIVSKWIEEIAIGVFRKKLRGHVDTT